MNLISHGSNRPCFGDSDVRCLRLPIRVCPQSRCGRIDQLADPATFLAAARLIPPLPTERSARHANQGQERPLGRSRIKPHPDDRSIFCNAILRWNGQRFVAEDSGVSANLRGGWGSDPGNVWAVGEGGTLLHKDGAKWQSLTTDTSVTLESVIGTAEGVFAVGGSSTVLRWDGTALGRETTSCAASLLGIAASGMDLISVGEGYCMTRRSAGVWGAMPSLSTPPTDKSGYFSVVGSNGNNTWVSGRPGNIYRFDGNAWSQFELKTMEVARSLFALPSGELWIGGTDLYKLTSSLPTRINARPQEAIYSLSAATAGTLWAVGFQGTVLRRSGTTWEPIRSEATSSLYGVFSPSEEQAYVIGFDALGSTLSLCANRVCSVIEKPKLGVEYAAIHGVDAETFWVVGKAGVVKTWSMKGGSLVDDASTLGGSAALNQVFALDATHVYAVGEQGLVAVRGSAGWAADGSAPTGRQNLQAVWASATSDLWVGGSNGFVAHFDGSAWSTMSSGVSETISSIAGTSPTDVWAVTLQGTVLRYNGQSFAIVSRDELPRLHAIVSKGGHLYLSGALGTILHRSPTE